MDREKTRTEAWMMLTVVLIEAALIVAAGYLLFSWLGRTIARVIA